MGRESIRLCRAWMCGEGEYMGEEEAREEGSHGARLWRLLQRTARLCPGLPLVNLADNHSTRGARRGAPNLPLW
jgi:hypothetical protein